MLSRQLAYFLLVQASFFALGAALVSLYTLLTRRPSYWWAYLLVKAGSAVIIGIILWLVLPVRAVETSWKADVYIGAVWACAIGMVGVSRDILRRAGRKSGKEVH